MVSYAASHVQFVLIRAVPIFMVSDKDIIAADNELLNEEYLYIDDACDI